MDREKVIKALECEEYSEYARCNQCPYVKFHKCKTLLMRDAIALLKEQEAVEPQIAPFPDTSRSDGSWYYVCGTCYKPIDPKDKYCRHCGQAVKWE